MKWFIIVAILTFYDEIPGAIVRGSFHKSVLRLKDLNISTQDIEDVVSRQSHGVARLFPYSGESSSLVVACAPGDYSASVVARAVEDCDAHLINLNVSEGASESGETLVYLRVSHRNGESVARSIERFGYHVLRVYDVDGSISDDTARERVNQLLRYLEI